MACVSAAEKKNMVCEHGAVVSQVCQGIGLPVKMS